MRLPISEIDREWYPAHPTRRGPDLFRPQSGLIVSMRRMLAGVLYVAADPHVALIESFQIAGLHPVLTASKLRDRSSSRIRIRRAARLVNLAQSGRAHTDWIGADARIFRATNTPSGTASHERFETIPNRRTAFFIDLAMIPRGLLRPGSLKSRMMCRI
jgi:hypothetical protein